MYAGYRPACEFTFARALSLLKGELKVADEHNNTRRNADPEPTSLHPLVSVFLGNHHREGFNPEREG